MDVKQHYTSASRQRTGRRSGRGSGRPLCPLGAPDGVASFYNWPMACRSPTLRPRSGSADALSTSGSSVHAGRHRRAGGQSGTRAPATGRPRRWEVSPGQARGLKEVWSRRRVCQLGGTPSPMPPGWPMAPSPPRVWEETAHRVSKIAWARRMASCCQTGKASRGASFLAAPPPSPPANR